MGRNSHYFVGKEERARVARSHTANMDEHYGSEISEAIRHSIVYSGGNPNIFCRKDIQPMTSGETKIEVIDSGTIEAIFKYKAEAESMGVLNFASYTHPGGMFMLGSKAQEECLCHASFLYNVLGSAPLSDFYEWNNKHKNRGMYLDRAIYTPGVRFFDYENMTPVEGHGAIPDSVTCSVITCASPNWSVAMRYGKFTKNENLEAVSKRVEFILHIAANFYVKTLILGAFGCGVFAQDATEMSTIFKYWLDGKYKNVFKHVVFAIPDSPRDRNYTSFKNTFTY